MPEISRFLGIIIYMYFSDHNPPHFHIRYNEYEGIISIETLKALEGNLPQKIINLVQEWAKEHKSELQQNWDTLQTSGEYHKIKPLV